MGTGYSICGEQLLWKSVRAYSRLLTVKITLYTGLWFYLLLKPLIRRLLLAQDDADVLSHFPLLDGADDSGSDDDEKQQRNHDRHCLKCQVELCWLRGNVSMEIFSKGKAQSSIKIGIFMWLCILMVWCCIDKNSC